MCQRAAAAGARSLLRARSPERARKTPPASVARRPPCAKVRKLSARARRPAYAPHAHARPGGTAEEAAGAEAAAGAPHPGHDAGQEHVVSRAQCVGAEPGAIGPLFVKLFKLDLRAPFIGRRIALSSVFEGLGRRARVAQFPDSASGQWTVAGGWGDSRGSVFRGV